MKKILALTALLAAVSMVSALPAAAATVTANSIKKGTPVIDGELDEIYRQSAQFLLDAEDIGAVYSTYSGEYDHNAGAHFLWDEEYLYMYVYVQDNDTVTHGEDYIKENGNGAWQNDAVETWFVVDEESMFKVHNDAYGYTMFAAAEVGSTGSAYTPEIMFDIENSIYKTIPGSNGYAIEVAFKPLESFKADSTIQFCIQVNDIQDETASTIYCSGAQDPSPYMFTLSAEEVVIEAPAEDVPAEGTDAPAADAPVTADAGIVAAMGVMAAAAAVVLSKKNH